MKPDRQAFCKAVEENDNYHDNYYYNNDDDDDDNNNNNNNNNNLNNNYNFLLSSIPTKQFYSRNRIKKRII